MMRLKRELDRVTEERDRARDGSKKAEQARQQLEVELKVRLEGGWRAKGWVNGSLQGNCWVGAAGGCGRQGVQAGRKRHRWPGGVSGKGKDGLCRQGVLAAGKSVIQANVRLYHQKNPVWSRHVSELASGSVCEVFQDSAGGPVVPLQSFLAAETRNQ